MKKNIFKLMMGLLLIPLVNCSKNSSELASSKAEDLALYTYVSQIQGEEKASVLAKITTPPTTEFEHNDYFINPNTTVLFNQGEDFYLKLSENSSFEADLFIATSPDSSETDPGAYTTAKVAAASLGSSYIVGYTDSENNNVEQSFAVPSSYVSVTAPTPQALVDVDEPLLVQWDKNSAGNDSLLLTLVPTFIKTDSSGNVTEFDYYFGSYISDEATVSNTGSYSYVPSFVTAGFDIEEFTEAYTKEKNPNNYIGHWNLYVVRRRAYLNNSSSPFNQSYGTIDLVTKIPVQLVQDRP